MLDCCKFQAVSKMTILDSAASFQRLHIFPNILTLMLLIRFSANSAVSPVMVNVLDTWICEFVGILPLTKRWVNRKNCFVWDQLQFYNHSASFDDFSSLICDKKVFTKTERESVNNERQIIFKLEDYIGTIASVHQPLIVRSLVEFCWF